MGEAIKQLGRAEADILLAYAREVIAGQLGLADRPADLLAPVFQGPAATFVTLKIDHQLRGCIGTLTPVGSLAAAVRDNAINAALYDSRFSPLTAEEFSQIEIDISILSQPTELSYTSADDLLAKLRPGIDGVILSQGSARATFLPQVWEQLSQPEDFLGHLCRKAGLSATCWRNQHPQIHIYQVQSITEEERT